MNVISSILYFIGEKMQRSNGIEDVPLSPAGGELSLAVAKHNSDEPSKPIVVQEIINIPASGDSLIGVDSSGNMTTYPNANAWGRVIASEESTPSKEYNYFSPTYNNGQSSSVTHDERGFEYGRGTVMLSTGRTSTASYFKVPAGVSWIEINGYIALENDTAEIRRYSVQACRTNDLTVAPTTTSLATTVTPATASSFSLQGSAIIPVNAGDYVFIRGYKQTASSSQKVTRGEFHIKAIA